MAAVIDPFHTLTSSLLLVNTNLLNTNTTGHSWSQAAGVIQEAVSFS